MMVKMGQVIFKKCVSLFHRNAVDGVKGAVGKGLSGTGNADANG